jgi:SRSO17 transposase
MVLSPEDKQLARWQMEDIQERLAQFLKPFLEQLTHSHQQLYAEVYFKGRFPSSARRTSEPVARAAKVDHRGLQYFISESRWKDRALRDVMRDQMRKKMGRKNGVLIVDASACEKSGKDTVGVKRQYNGRLGKVDNCVVGEYLAYASGGSVALVDCELYLPKEWSEDQERRTKCHIPEDLVFKEGHAIGLDLVLRHAEVFPHCATVGDEAYGKVDGFRDGFRENEERLLGEIPSNRTMRLASGGDWLHANELGEALLKEKAETFDSRDSERGPIKLNAAKCRVFTARAALNGKARPDVAEVFVVVRNEHDSKTWYYLGTDDKTTLKEWVRIGCCRTGIEYAFQMAKGEAGMDEYEMRGYVGWQHHMTLSIMALWFLVDEERWLKKRGFACPPAKFEKLWPTSVSDFGLSTSFSKKPRGNWGATRPPEKSATELDEPDVRRAPRSASRGRRQP